MKYKFEVRIETEEHIESVDYEKCIELYQSMIKIFGIKGKCTFDGGLLYKLDENEQEGNIQIDGNGNRVKLDIRN